MTKREAVLSAFHAVLIAALPDVTVRRNAVLAAEVPAGGLVTLRDGDPGEGEPQLSPPAWFYEHRAELELVVDAPTEGERDAALDALAKDIGLAIAADRTLGGTCDYVQALAPSVTEFPADGGVALRGATVPVVLIYVSADPLA